jgi:hypothetical protein
MQAVALNPLRARISWKDIADYSFLGEFDVLRHSRTDIHELDWAKPTHREALVKFYKLRRAHEEVEHLNIEVSRLQTAIHDEGMRTSATINKLLDSNPPRGCELQKRWKLCSAVNSVHLIQLDEIESQSGFSGIQGRGRWIGSLAENEHPSGAFIFQNFRFFF